MTGHAYRPGPPTGSAAAPPPSWVPFRYVCPACYLKDHQQCRNVYCDCTHLDGGA